MNARTVGIIIRRGKVLLMKRVKEGEEYYVFLGGSIEPGEKPEDAVKREIKEECNLHVVAPELLFENNNRGRMEYYFLITKSRGAIQVNSPEKERISQTNQYLPEWKTVTELSTLKNLYPVSVRARLVKIIKKFKQD